MIKALVEFNVRILSKGSEVHTSYDGEHELCDYTFFKDGEQLSFDDLEDEFTKVIPKPYTLHQETFVCNVDNLIAVKYSNHIQIDYNSRYDVLREDIDNMGENEVFKDDIYKEVADQALKQKEIQIVKNSQSIAQKLWQFAHNILEVPEEFQVLALLNYNSSSTYYGYAENYDGDIDYYWSLDSFVNQSTFKKEQSVV